jgi:two-component system sensor histidine kinase PilS (NtrC family)
MRAMAPALASAPADLQHRELYFFALFRVLEAGILGIVAFTPLGLTMADIRHPLLIQLAAAGYFLSSLLLLYASRTDFFPATTQAATGLVLDLLVWGTALLAMDGGESGLAMFMVFNIGAGSLILRPGASLGFATAAALVLLAEYFFNKFTPSAEARTAAEATMFSVTYLGTALLCQQLHRQMTATESLARRRGEELASLSELSELVIRRMRNGILVVDGNHRVRLSNEAAWALLGTPTHERQDLMHVSPELQRALWDWRQGRDTKPAPILFNDGAIEVIPRFVSLSQNDKLFLVFLDDGRLYSGRAEEMTLATLGRLSASIAHEIRNPLAAINYSTQLLEESPHLPDTDRRLLEIIHAQCTRMNGIVQNILGLARRDRSQTEPVELVGFTQRFVQEYRESHPLETDILQAVDAGKRAVALVDPQHLTQVLTILVHNALTYGREPGKPAQVTVAVRQDRSSGQPVVEVIDRGPGIAPRVAQQIFTAFYTTSEHGTGLGLYIARQLCEANQCVLAFEPVPLGGACFRVVLPAARSLLQPAVP